MRSACFAAWAGVTHTNVDIVELFRLIEQGAPATVIEVEVKSKPPPMMVTLVPPFMLPATDSDLNFSYIQLSRQKW